MVIRKGKISDAAVLAEIERVCFPAAEAASEKAITERLRAFPAHFWIMEEDGGIVSFVNGMVTDEEHLTDEMYENTALHNENGQWQMIFGVDTLPEYRGRGFAGRLIEKAVEDARRQGRKGVVLTCKEGLIPFYSRHGFVNRGVSESVHGGAVWYEMRLEF